MNEHLRAKYETIRAKEQQWKESNTEDAELIVVAFGTVSYTHLDVYKRQV